MKKILKNILFILIIFFIGGPIVNANSIRTIDMYINIDKEGNAIVTETWNVYLNEGSEGFRVFSNLGQSEISNFTVSDDKGIEYESLPSWNTYDSFDAKAYKSGINDFYAKTELCWGISEYGNRQYTLSYEISNFVTEYTDYQGIDFNLLNLNQNIGSVTITIYADEKFEKDFVKIWGFGYEGDINIVDGAIVLKSDGILLSSEYMVSLVKFERPLFETTNMSTQKFEDALKDALEDTEPSVSYEEIEGLLPVFTGLYIIAFGFLIFIIYLMINFIKTPISGLLDFGSEGKSLPTLEDTPYYREVPCNKNLDRAYWIIDEYDIVSHSTLQEGVIGAILLKWVKEGKITITETKKGLFNFMNGNYAVDLSNVSHISNTTENELLTILKEAAGNNTVLEAREFEKWCRKKHSKVDAWFSSLKNRAQLSLENEGLIVEETEEVKGFLGKKHSIKTKKVSSKLKKEAIKLKGFMKFLSDFSNMPEREYKDVALWEEYLIFAELFGIAKKVADQFKDLYPEFNEVSKLTTDVNVTAVLDISFHGYWAVRKGKGSSSYGSYSGGGGRSFSGGGGSSRGSSGGGFR